jgi:integrase
MLHSLFPQSHRRFLSLPLLGLVADGFDAISHYLGHASPNTTNRYAKVDLEMKRKAIARVKPVPRQSRAHRGVKIPRSLTGWSLFKP